MEALLEIDNVSMHFGGLRAIQGLSFHVLAGEIVSLIGPNGAGKSTVLNLVSGLHRPPSGSIRFEGRPISGLAPDAIARAGIGRTFQSLRLFMNMSVHDNVLAATYHRTRSQVWQMLLRTPAFRREEAQRRQIATELLGIFGNQLQVHRHHEPAYSLSYANRRRLEIARVLAMEPRLLLLDEPAAGMNPHETAELTELIGALRDRYGCAILLIEHHMGLVEHVSDRVIVLDHGKKIAEGPFAEVTANTRVIEAYLGRRREDADATASAI